MNPSDANSPLATLRQLKEMLDAGTLTPQEFEALKQQLVFGNAVPAIPLSSTPSPLPLAAPLPLPGTEEPITASAPAPEVSSVADSPDWLAAPAPRLAEAATLPATYSDEAEERRNPLTLVFAIGGALLLLSIILYLMLGHSTSADEHLTSASQTAADSTAVAPEVGPQAQQITLAPTAPETIRVAPAIPPPTATVPAKFRTDSVAVPVSTAPTQAPAPTTPVKAPVPAKSSVPAKAALTPAVSPDSSSTKAGQP